MLSLLIQGCVRGEADHVIRAWTIPYKARITCNHTQDLLAGAVEACLFASTCTLSWTVVLMDVDLFHDTAIS